MQKYDFALIDQIKAAPYTKYVIENLIRAGLLDPYNANHKAVIETDIYRLRRGLCLPSASSACINLVLGKRLIGDDEGLIKVGDFLKYLMPHHGKYKSKLLPMGWLVVTDQGDMYHHGIIAIAKTLGISACSVNNFQDLEVFKPIIDSGGSVAVSMDNRFVTGITLKKSGLVKFEPGRHVVTLLEINGNHVLFSDSFNLPQIDTHKLKVSTTLKKANDYLRYYDNNTTRAIIFFKSDSIDVPNINISKTFIPQKVLDTLTSQLSGICS